jgi:hypothetical protein
MKLISPETKGVAIQQKMISRMILKFTTLRPLTNPTPKIAPTMEWLVETGIPNTE